MNNSDNRTVTNKPSALADPDMRETLLAGGVLCLLLLGLPYLLSWLRVVSVALTTRRCAAAGPVLVCGHRLEDGGISNQYRLRLDEAARLSVTATGPVLLLGGGSPSEAATGRDYLVAICGMDPRRLVLEEESTDSLENLRNAKHLLMRGEITADITGDVVLISSRYHLARLRAFARQLGLDCRLHPAESRARLGLAEWKTSFTEAAFLCLFYLGRFYARVARRWHLLARIE